jgi:hypothetical protein
MFYCLLLQVHVKLQHQLHFRQEAYLLILHIPEDEEKLRDISKQQPIAAAQANTTASIPHIRTEACIAEDHAQSPLATEKSRSDPCLSGLDNEQAVPAVGASGTTDASNGDVAFMSSSADDQSGLIDAAPSRTAIPSGAFAQKSNVGSQQEAPQAALQKSGWQGVQTRALQDRPHKLQAWFGEDAFLTLIPSSYSRRILNEQVSFTHCPRFCSKQEEYQQEQHTC